MENQMEKEVFTERGFLHEQYLVKEYIKAIGELDNSERESVDFIERVIK